jgi:hypothetical protein
MRICGIFEEDVEHIQRRRIMEVLIGVLYQNYDRIWRGFVSCIFRRMVVTTRDNCGSRRD